MTAELALPPPLSPDPRRAREARGNAKRGALEKPLGALSVGGRLSPPAWDPPNSPSLV